MIQLVPFWKKFNLKENVKLDVKLKYFIVSPIKKKNLHFCKKLSTHSLSFKNITNMS